MKRLFLFDMDGTLTPPRQKMDINCELMITNIQRSGSEVGIITGSDMNYIKQQCSGMFDMSLTNVNKIHFLPCNGTKYYFNKQLVYSNNMSEYMGTKNWRALIGFLVDLQRELCQTMPASFPLTGHFFDYRESTLNWCPIGRNANQKDREKWESLDQDNALRLPLMERIRDVLSSMDVEITVKLGGDTSFDIFPAGWDKTYPLENTDIFSSYDEIYFVGDRCGKNGNDYEIYSHPKVNGYETTGVLDTLNIVNKILEKIVSYDDKHP